MAVDPRDYEAWKQRLREELKREVLEEIRKALKLEERGIKIATRAKIAPARRQAIHKPADALQLQEFVAISMLPIFKIAVHALKYANAQLPRSRWVEVIGLLAGRLNERQNALYVEDAYPMGHGDAMYSQITDQTRYMRAYRAMAKSNRFICGWYHSHPSYGLFISQEDFETQARYQQLWGRSIALVVDPYQINGKGLGLGIFRADVAARKWFSLPFQLREPVDPRLMPQLLELFRAAIDGKYKIG